MADIIIQKICSECKIPKPIMDFYKNKSSKGGYRGDCKACILERRYIFRRTEHYRQYCRLRKPNPELTARINKRYDRKYPERRTAKGAVSSAIRSGILPKAKYCLCKCGKPAQHYHHHLGYEPSHCLDVIPVCAICHKAIHANDLRSQPAV